MAENSYEELKNAIKFTYEVSLWTLLDSFITVLKWAYIDAKGLIQNPEIKLSDDGTREFSFSIPKFYYLDTNKTFNPLWHKIEKLPIEANMHKLKVIFNKNTEDEAVEEFLVTSVTETHEQDNVVIEVSAEGLAFHELGKIGYKISLSTDNFILAVQDWFTNGMFGNEPKNNIQYWNDLIFKDENGNWKTDWRYEVVMDWSSYSQALSRESNIIYEDEYVASWTTDENNIFHPKGIEKFKEKLRLVDAEESNIYNITQDIAKAFGVFCKYKYEYDDSYYITRKKVIYYNNYELETSLLDDLLTTHLDLTYPYSSSSIKRTIDNTDVITKMFVRTVDSLTSESNIISIMSVEANKSKEDYLLNFDYLHEIGTISDELYEAISIYEAKMHKINSLLVEIETKIEILSNKLIEALAKYTFYTNAIQLDLERYDNAIAERNALTGGTDYIELTAFNPGKATVNRDTIGSKGVYITIKYPGLDVASLHLYEKIDHTKINPEERLTSLNTSGTLVFDEFGELVEITNITLNNSDTTIINLVGQYSPDLYWDKVAAVWLARKALDEEALKTVTMDEAEILWQLYGARTDFAHVDSAKASGESISDVALASDPDNNLFRYVGSCRVCDLDLNNEPMSFINIETYTQELIYHQESLLKEKQKLIAEFERMMGPALREGYWQPEDYNDYGDRYLDQFTINRSFIIEPKNSDLISFSWDCEKLYDDEEGILFQSSVDGTMELYLIVDLSECLDLIKDNLNNLSFIYYDRTSVMELLLILAKQLNYEANPTSWTESLIENLTAELERLKDTKIVRSFTIGAQCEFGFIRETSNTNNLYYKPVLIITGSTLLTEDLIKFIYGEDTELSNLLYKPQIGIYNTIVANDGTAVTLTITTLVLNLTFIRGNFIDLSIALTRENYSILRVYPRIFINSLKLKNSSDELFINLNNSPLDSFTDYSVLTDQRGDTVETYKAGYYITLKPNRILAEGNHILKIDLAFTLSNADVAIYLDAIKIMKENAYPKVSYEVALCALNYNLVRIAYSKLNYIVHINDIDLLLLDVCGYISSVTLPLDKIWETSVEIKNYETKFEDLFSTIVALTESMQKNENTINSIVGIVSTDGWLAPKALQESMARADLTYSFNLGTLTIDLENGIWGTSDDGVVAFRGGGIFTATAKDENDNWLWNTGILPSGINANLITSGQIDTNKIKIYAGDLVKFLLNGEGLFAYKSLLDDEAYQLPPDIYQSYIEEYDTVNNADIDARLYVTFNSQGLFLVAKPGALILNPDNTNYSTILDEINRVEISWKGLILRNNIGDTVFYADNNGNLTLTGTIHATSGDIGGENGWHIDDGILYSDHILLLSTLKGDYSPGIILTDSVNNYAENITYNNEIYYICKNILNLLDTTTYYVKTYPNSIIDDFYPSAQYPYYTFETVLTAVIPRYPNTITIEGTTTTTTTSGGNELTGTYTGTLVELNINTVTYIYTSSSYKTPLKDINNQYIIYDGDNSMNASWYTKLLEKYGSIDVTQYVYYDEETQMIEQTNYNKLLKILTDLPTFSVNAITGEVSISNGYLGSFQFNTKNISSNYTMNIASTNLSGDNRVEGNSNYTLSKYKNCFCSFTSDSSKGTFTLTNIAGTKVTFNIASTNFFKTKLAEAGKLTKATSKTSGSNVVFTIESGYGNKYTRTHNVSGIYTNGLNSVTINSITFLRSGNTIKATATASNKATRTASYYITGGSTSGGTTSGGRSTGSCFVKGTLIKLYNGIEIPIEELQLDMNVKAYDEEAELCVSSTIVGVLKFDNIIDIYDIYLSSNKKLTLTSSHPILTSNGWRAIDIEAAYLEHEIYMEELQIGDTVISENSEVTVTDIIHRKDLDGSTVYNIDVEPIDTYFANSIVVHNKG